MAFDAKAFAGMKKAGDGENGVSLSFSFKDKDEAKKFLFATTRFKAGAKTDFSNPAKLMVLVKTKPENVEDIRAMGSKMGAIDFKRM